MTRKERIEKIKIVINDYDNHEIHFKKLYNELEEEIRIVKELNDPNDKKYLFHLETTKEKQAETFLNAKTKKDRRESFDEFVSHFKKDLMEH